MRSLRVLIVPVEVEVLQIIDLVQAVWVRLVEEELSDLLKMARQEQRVLKAKREVNNRTKISRKLKL
jgi:hypothetical protein